MTNKIILETLKLAGFQNPTAIAEILNYVPNSNVALEMLLGIHVPAVLDDATKYRKYRHDTNAIVEITGIDQLANKISYNKYKQQTKNVYYMTREDRDRDIYQLERPKGDYYTSGSIPANGYTKSSDSCYVKDFEVNYDELVLNEDATNLLIKWTNFGKLILKEEESF